MIFYLRKRKKSIVYNLNLYTISSREKCILTFLCSVINCCIIPKVYFKFYWSTTYCHTKLYCYMYVILHPICVKIQTCKLLNLTHSGSFFLRVTAFKKLYQIHLYPFGLWYHYLFNTWSQQNAINWTKTRYLWPPLWFEYAK